jgi:hypothetical protein
VSFIGDQFVKNELVDAASRGMAFLKRLRV